MNKKRKKNGYKESERASACLSAKGPGQENDGTDSPISRSVSIERIIHPFYEIVIAVENNETIMIIFCSKKNKRCFNIFQSIFIVQAVQTS